MKKHPGLSPSKARARTEREARLTRALRDNLRRRKEQARVQAERDRDAGLSPALSDGPLSSKTDRRGGASTAD